LVIRFLGNIAVPVQRKLWKSVRHNKFAYSSGLYILRLVAGFNDLPVQDINVPGPPAAGIHMVAHDDAWLTSRLEAFGRVDT